MITRRAMAGLGLRPPNPYHIETSEIHGPDRGGRSYWKFPQSALDSLKRAASPSHSLRPTPSSTVAAALRLIQLRFAGLHRRAMLEPPTRRKRPLEWLGEALHLFPQIHFRARETAASATSGPS